MSRLAACAAIFALGACHAAPFGEVLVVVDTDVSVPTFASQLQLDLYAPDGTWYDSRQMSTLRVDEWPLSFSLYTDEHATKDVLMRLRVFPQGALRDYLGEQPPGPPPFVPPHAAASLEELCAGPPLLPPFVELTQRRGPDPLTEHPLTSQCLYKTESGSVAAAVQIATTGSYRFEVVHAVPDGSNNSPPGSTTIMLRRACADAASEIACAAEIDKAEGDLLSRLEVTLEPGTYYLVTGSYAAGSPADLTLRWSPSDEWSMPTPAPRAPAPPTLLPRLLEGGVDETPASEPQPNLGIDRLIALSVEFGTRRTLAVLMSGECYGTQADLANGTTCVDTAGVRAPIGRATLAEGIDRGGATRAGSWAAEVSAPCTTTPRDGTAQVGALHDEEICMPQGAFLLGSPELAGLGTYASTPQQMVALPSFLIDRYEVTVARYRQALRDGFSTPFRGVTANDGPLVLEPGVRDCTFSGDASGPSVDDRESYPLNCVSWDAARALCRFWGGDLPSAAQWEYAASVAGRGGTKSRFPWGDDQGTCSRAVFGNSMSGGPCMDQNVVPVDAQPWASGDVTALGVVGMAGNVSEWVTDSFRPYSDACWWQKTLRDVGCVEDDPPLRSIRGDDWLDPADGLVVAFPAGQAPEYPLAAFGMRCVRPGVAP